MRATNMKAKTKSKIHKAVKIAPAFGTQMIHGKKHKLYPAGAHISPIFLTTTYELRDLEYSKKVFSGKTNQDAYTRLSNPNHRELEERLRLAEGAELAQVFSTGMGAFTVMVGSLTKVGDHIVAGCPLYGGTYKALKTFWQTQEGRKVDFISVNDQYALKKVVTPKTKLFIFETITNPSIQCWDIPFVVKTLRAINPNIIIVADNTFATPYNCKPLQLGVDVVWHSLTKYFSEGHHLGGAVIGSSAVLKPLVEYYPNLGAMLDPSAAWSMSESCKTFPLRMQRHNENAMAIAEFLEKQPKIARVSYLGLPSHPQHALAQKLFHTPDGKSGFGGMIAFEFKGSREMFDRFVDTLKEFITFGVSLGTPDTLANAPYFSTHFGVSADEAKLQGVTDHMIRLSVGCEDIKDIRSWFERAL